MIIVRIVNNEKDYFFSLSVVDALKMKWISLLFVCGVFGAVQSQSPCVTPNGETAQCISIYKCQVFVDGLRARTPEVIRFMRESRCGYMEDPLVCCGSVVKYAPVATPPPTVATSVLQHRNRNFLPARGKCGIPGTQEKVFGGNETGLDEFPWMALLEYKASNGQSAGHSCGGTLINERYVVTAAHCIVGRIKVEVGDVFRVRLGEHDQNKPIDCESIDGDEICADPPVDIDVEEAIAHPQYNDQSISKYHDIGLIRLKTAPKYSDYIKPICLPTQNEETPVGKNSTVAGWGFTEKGIFSPIKLKADIPIVQQSQCEQVFKAKSVDLRRTQLCAGGLKGIDSCSGDSGGPLMSFYPRATDIFLEGIVSFGATACGTEGLPGIYTRVSEYTGWILENMKPY